MRRPQHLALVTVLAGVAAVGAGCARPKTEAKAPVRAVKHTPPDIDYAKVRPNELGYIPVIMYHEIGGKPVKSDPSLVRQVDAFRKDVQLLYDAGFRPVNLSDVLEDRIDLPPGTSPVVLTFDDGRESQFRLIETSDALKIDPDCAMGVLDAFHKKHPDWEMRATFFVLPKSRKTMEPFGQLGRGAQKLDYLLKEGMEIGNHSTLHEDMSRMTPAQLQAEIGGAHNSLTAMAPEAKITAIALPMGKYPRNKAHWKYLTKGTYQGKSYEYKGAMKAAYRAIPAPANNTYDPLQLERVSCADVNWGVRDWIKRLTSGGMYPRYVSDGDPNVVSYPKGSESLVNTTKLAKQNKLANAYSPFGGDGGSKPIISAAEESPSSAKVPTTTVTEKPITGG